jgi:hypothetical protein
VQLTFPRNSCPVRHADWRLPRPQPIAAAVFSGHRFALELDASDPGFVPIHRKRATVEFGRLAGPLGPM